MLTSFPQTQASVFVDLNIKASPEASHDFEDQPEECARPNSRHATRPVRCQDRPLGNAGEPLEERMGRKGQNAAFPVALWQ